MKIKELKLKNVGDFEELELVFNNNITRFVGLNGAGKTTILKSIWASFKGIALNDKGGNIIGDRLHFIGKFGSSSDIQTILIDDNGKKTTVTTKITKSGNHIEFKNEEGEIINDEWVKNILDVALMNAVEFCKLSSLEQSKRLGIDTEKFDKDLQGLKEEYTLINRDFRNFGELVEIEKTDKISIKDLFDEKDKIQRHNSEQAIRESKIERYDNEIRDIKTDISELESKLKEKKERLSNGLEYLNKLPKPEESQSTDGVQEKIDNAEQINTKADAYNTYLTKKSSKDIKEKELNNNKDKQSKKESEKLDYIKSFDFGFKGLGVDEKGGLILDGRAIVTYSQAEREIIVANLARAQNPLFKVRLIDEFQSLDLNNQSKMIDDLLKDGYQLLIAEVGEKKKDSNSILLRKCKVVEENEKPEQPKLL